VRQGLPLASRHLGGRTGRAVERDVHHPAGQSSLLFMGYLLNPTNIREFVGSD
jgi:hypothetical protein